MTSRKAGAEAGQPLPTAYSKLPTIINAVDERTVFANFPFANLPFANPAFYGTSFAY